MEERITSHICSALIVFNISFSTLFSLHVKSKGGCQRRQLSCLVHIIEVATIYNAPPKTDRPHLSHAGFSANALSLSQ